jgi:hypothetical protein
METVQEDDSD